MDKSRYSDIPIVDGKYLLIPITDLIFHIYILISYYIKYNKELYKYKL